MNDFEISSISKEQAAKLEIESQARKNLQELKDTINESARFFDNDDNSQEIYFRKPGENDQDNFDMNIRVSNFFTALENTGVDVSDELKSRIKQSGKFSDRDSDEARRLFKLAEYMKSLDDISENNPVIFGKEKGSVDWQDFIQSVDDLTNLSTVKSPTREEYTEKRRFLFWKRNKLKKAQNPAMYPNRREEMAADHSDMSDINKKAVQEFMKGNTLAVQDVATWAYDNFTTTYKDRISPRQYAALERFQQVFGENGLGWLPKDVNLVEQYNSEFGKKEAVPAAFSYDPNTDYE